MAKSLNALMECESYIRWDDTGGHATLWTASVKVRKEWKAFGFPIIVHGGGWQSSVPVDRITYKTVKKS